MCGSENKLFKCKIEGTILNLCKNCSQHGEIISEVKTEQKEEIKKPIISEEEIIQIVNNNYPKIVKEKRELIKLKQKELAQKIGEKESIIHQIESGHLKPNITLARKLETFLKIKIVETYTEKHDSNFKKNTETITIGDLIKIKKK